jgi:hypothetical protein
MCSNDGFGHQLSVGANLERIDTYLYYDDDNKHTAGLMVSGYRSLLMHVQNDQMPVVVGFEVSLR